MAAWREFTRWVCFTTATLRLLPHPFCDKTHPTFFSFCATAKISIKQIWPTANVPQDNLQSAHSKFSIQLMSIYQDVWWIVIDKAIPQRHTRNWRKHPRDKEEHLSINHIPKLERGDKPFPISIVALGKIKNALTPSGDVITIRQTYHTLDNSKTIVNLLDLQPTHTPLRRQSHLPWCTTIERFGPFLSKRGRKYMREIVLSNFHW